MKKIVEVGGSLKYLVFLGKDNLPIAATRRAKDAVALIDEYMDSDEPPIIIKVDDKVVWSELDESFCAPSNPDAARRVILSRTGLKE